MGTTRNVLGWGTSTSRELDGVALCSGHEGWVRDLPQTRNDRVIPHRTTEKRESGHVCLHRVTTHVSTQCRTYQHGLSRNVASLEGATCMAEQGWWRSHDWGTRVPGGTLSRDRVAWWRAGLPLPS